MTTVDQPLLSEVIDLDHGGVRGIACQSCARKSLSVRELCPLCGSAEVTAVTLAPAGRVVSWTVVRQAPAHLPTPYTLATVDLDDGIRILGYADNGIAIDDRVKIELFPLRTGHDGQQLWWYRFNSTSKDN